MCPRQSFPPLPPSRLPSTEQAASRQPTTKMGGKEAGRLFLAAFSFPYTRSSTLPSPSPPLLPATVPEIAFSSLLLPLCHHFPPPSHFLALDPSALFSSSRFPPPLPPEFSTPPAQRQRRRKKKGGRLRCQRWLDFFCAVFPRNGKDSMCSYVSEAKMEDLRAQRPCFPCSSCSSCCKRLPPPPSIHWKSSPVRASAGDPI